jgi:hypothetical protein
VSGVPLSRLARRLALSTFVAVAVAVLLWAGAGVAGAVFREYGFNPETGERAWRALDPRFGDARTCGTCHEPQQAKLVSASHEGIGCQSCHGALAEHEALAAGDEIPDGGTIADTVRTPNEAICLTCHTTVNGQPASFRSVVVANHYMDECLSCHDPHTGISQPPPVVLHPLERLPTCVTCHGPDGFMARLDRHPETTEDDQTCLLCHAIGRGPEQ